MDQPTIRKRPHYYLTEKWYTDLVILILPGIARTGITPNQVTLANLVNGLIIFALLLTGHFLAAALLIQVYLIFDILDGNLARYTATFSKLGAVLDNLGDRFFYNGVIIVIGLATGSHWGWTIFFLIAHNLHAAAATLYIVPRIKAHPDFRRFRHKQYLMDRGYILGMDLSSQDLIMSVLLLTSWSHWIVPITASLYAADVLYRLLELQCAGTAANG